MQVQEDPEIFCQIEHISRLIAYAPPRLSWTPVLQGRNLYLLSPRLPKAFTGTNTQEGLTIFDTSTQYTFLYSGCTHSINPYFELYTEYNPL